MKETITTRRNASQARSRATVERCLDACRDLMIGSGFEQLTMSDVAREAGVAMGTLYQYFGDRSALLEVLLERHNAAIGIELEEALDDVDDVEDLIARMTRLSDRYFALHAADPFVRALWTGIQGDSRLQQVDFEDTRAKAAKAVRLTRRVYRGADAEVLTARWFVILQTSLYIARLAALSPAPDSEETRRTFQDMASAAFRLAVTSGKE